MPLFLIILVAAVQGITEFLPVSSSGHLALIPVVTDQPYQGRAIDVAAHVGTLGAVLLYLRRDLTDMLSALLPGGDAATRKLIAMLIIATLPVILAGFIINKLDPTWLTDVRVLAASNLIFAGLLWQADRIGRMTRAMGEMTFGPAIAIGLAQCLALVPGASRSGVTMTAALFFGFDRLAAARFSLLLSIPTIAGAGLLKGIDIAREGDAALGMDAALVALLSFGFALAAIGWMMRWLARADFRIFVWYRLGLGGALILALTAGLV